MNQLLSPVLMNKINFTVLYTARKANTSGNPQADNMPRTTVHGLGEVTDVCIKRKIRNRLQDMGLPIFIQTEERCDDGYESLCDRAAANITAYKTKKDYLKQACEKWVDVRSFGQVFAFKNKNAPSTSVSVTGPVSIQISRSISPVEINSLQITKSVNGETADKKTPDTMGMKHFVEFGLYRVDGTINAQIAARTGFTNEDAACIKEALRTLFVNDASAARPEGSMEVVAVYWWEHDCKDGQYSAAQVFRTLDIHQKKDCLIPTSLDDYEIILNNLPGLEPEILKGV